MKPILKEEYFQELSRLAFSLLNKNEHLFVGFAGESSEFVRLNASKVRQIGHVDDAVLELTFVSESSEGLRKGTAGWNLTGRSSDDQDKLKAKVASLRDEVSQLPVDPFAPLPENHGASRSEKKGKLLELGGIVERLCRPAQSVDLAGLYAGGEVVRAMANSAGLSHWFATENFVMDYSLYSPEQRAVKSFFGGSEWSDEIYQRHIDHDRQKLEALQKPSRRLERGAYRAFLRPDAVHDLINMFSWGCVSEAAIRQGDSPLRKLQRGEREFSSLFALDEDFSCGNVPRFNTEGDLAPEKLEVIAGGKLKNSLVSRRSAKEYKLAANGATDREGLRSPSVRPGVIREADILSKLGTGLYLSNLHYLNWSDQQGGRITGMTRYACLWVEDGKMIGPIENMRWDDDIFSLFGSKLIGFTDFRVGLPETSTYGMRSLGISWLPGMMVSEMNFTL